LFSAVISEHFSKNRVIISEVVEKILYLKKMCGFYWATLYVHCAVQFHRICNASLTLCQIIIQSGDMPENKCLVTLKHLQEFSCGPWFAISQWFLFSLINVFTVNYSKFPLFWGPFNVHIRVQLQALQGSKHGASLCQVRHMNWYTDYICINAGTGLSRGGKGGKFSRAPQCLGGPAVAQKYWKWCSRWLLADLKYA